MAYQCMHLKFYDLSIRFYSVSLRKLLYYIRKPNEPQYQEHTFLQESS